MSKYHGREVLSSVELEHELEVEFTKLGDVILSREQLDNEGDVAYIDQIILSKENLQSLVKMYKEIYGE
jgi:hypothetical protein